MQKISRSKKCNRCWYIGFCQKNDSANLKSGVDKEDINKLENVTSNLSNLKSKVDKLDVDKLVPTPANLSKPTDVVKHDVVKKDDPRYAMIKDIKGKIHVITSLATNTTLNAKKIGLKIKYLVLLA